MACGATFLAEGEAYEVAEQGDSFPVGARDIYAEPHWDGTVLLAANESSVAPALKE